VRATRLARDCCYAYRAEGERTIRHPEDDPKVNIRSMELFCSALGNFAEASQACTLKTDYPIGTFGCVWLTTLARLTRLAALPRPPRRGGVRPQQPRFGGRCCSRCRFDPIFGQELRSRFAREHALWDQDRKTFRGQVESGGRRKGNHRFSIKTGGASALRRFNIRRIATERIDVVRR